MGNYKLGHAHEQNKNIDQLFAHHIGIYIG